jgi:chorismate mutase/prephenate dehydratase
MEGDKVLEMEPEIKLLIFGMGGMGRLFHEFFSEKGYYVKGYDILPRKSEVTPNQIPEFSVIFLCTPMNALSEAINTLRKIFENSDDLPLLVDISSIKKDTLPLLESSGFQFLSIHPMFGPDASLGMSYIAIVRKSGRPEERVILEEFKKAGAILKETTPERHDEIVAGIQGLTHFMLMAFSNFLAEKKGEIEFTTPVASLMIKLASRVLHQDWKLYFDIQRNAAETRKEFLRSITEFEELMDDEEGFREAFTRLSEVFKEHDSTDIILDTSKIVQKAENLHQLRGYVRVIDSLILRLLERRIEAGRRIAEIKAERDEPIEVAEVEEVKLRELISRTHLNPVLVSRIFEDIMRLTKEEEYRILGVQRKVAVLGPQGSFSDEVAVKLIGSRIPLTYCSTPEEILKKVERGEADYGIIPIENSVNGTVIPALDSLMKCKVEVFGETEMEITHCLAARKKLSLKEVKTVFSHPQAVAQCMGFLNNYLPHAEIRYTTSTSDAISMLDDSSAAIVSENAARLHRLYVLRKEIQDVSGNVTRFYIVRRIGEERKGDVTCLFFGVEDRPGALKEVLEIFYKKGINLRKLESRPSGTGLGDYVFFAEVEAALSEEDISELTSVTTFFRILGVFRRLDRLNVF